MNDTRHPHPTRRTGQVMLMISFALGLGVLTMVFDSLLGQRENPNQNPVSETSGDGSVRVELRRNAQGHYVVTGLLNGVQSQLLLDTGATDVVLSEQLARRAGLEAGYPTRAMTANGPVTVYSAVLDELRIGDITLQQVPASINPAMQGDAVLLGMSALKHIEFTQRGDSLTLRYIP